MRVVAWAFQKKTPNPSIDPAHVLSRAFTRYEAQHEGAQEAARQRREDAKQAALKAKAEGNTHFVAKQFAEAVTCYDAAIAHVRVSVASSLPPLPMVV